MINHKSLACLSILMALSFSAYANNDMANYDNKKPDSDNTVSMNVALFDYVFPENLRSYTAGTRVLQPRDGRIYQCRPFPNSGYCVQWSPSATQYEPGFGSHWTWAWIKTDYCP